MRGVLLCSFLLFVLCISAQEEPKERTLKDVQVNANRLLRDAGVQKTTLDTLVLHDNLSLSMADILSQHSTLFIKSYGRATESTAEFRGTSPSHTQVMWNGMSINSPMLGTFDFSTIPAFLVDQANLYHGASSINLTGGGLGGAISLKSTPVSKEGWGVQYVQGIGSYNTFDQFLRFNYANKHWSSSTRVMYATSENNFRYTNYEKKVDEKDEMGNITHSYHPKERNKSGYFDDLHVMHDLFYNDLHGNRFSLQAWYTHSKRGLPFLSVDYKGNTDFTNEQLSNTVRSVLSWEHIATKWKAGVKGGYSHEGAAYDYSVTHASTKAIITQSQSYTNTGHIQADASYIPNSHWSMEANLTARYVHVSSRDKTPFHTGRNYDRGRMEYNACAQARWRPVKPLTFAAVVRQEIYRDKALTPIPALFADYVVYRPWQLTLKASAARNSRYPSMNDLYFQPGGNPKLSPEHGFTYDGGIEFCIPIRKTRLEGNLCAFDSHISNWIQWLPNARGYWEPSNVKEVHNYGMESTLSWECPIRKDLTASLTANYAYTPSINQGKTLNANDNSSGKQLCYVPLHSANFCCRITWRSWAFSYKWNYYSERYTTTSNEADYITGRLKPYNVADIGLEKTFQYKRVQFSAKGVINNLMNAEYRTVLSRPMAPRNFEVFLGIKW